MSTSNLPQRPTGRARIHFTTSSDESSSSSSSDEDETSTNNNKSYRRPRTSREDKRAPTINRAAPKKQSSPRPTDAEDEEAPSTISWTRLDPPTKSPIDKNEYRLIKLKNGLKALIISCDEINNVDPPWLTVYPESQAVEPSAYANNPYKSFSLYSKFPSSNMYSFIPSTSKDAMNMNETSWTHESLLPSLFPSCVGDYGDGEHKSNGKDERQPPSFCASLMVNVGSYDDPPEFPGLAHLCEHLVHHGSKGFAEEEGYQRTVQSLGGRLNAFTDKEKTNYHFQVRQRDENFTGPKRVMEMLADFISYPLFPLESVQREIESVDNEFFMRKTSIHFRRDYLLNQLIVEDENHPLRTFCVGNKDKLMPNHVHNSGIKLRNALKEFHKKYYLAENMNLVVQASVPIDILEAQVADIFENIPSNLKTPEKCRIRKSSSPTTKRSSAKTPYDNKNFNKMVTIIPNEEVNQLTIMWALPPDAGQNYKTKPLDYIGALLSDSSPNGLEACLRKEHLVIKLFSGNLKFGCFQNKYVSLFIIDATLTTKGRDEIEKVLEIIFSYLQLIKEEGVDKKLYTQLDTLEQIHFKYFPPSTSLQNIVQLSDNMRWCPPKDLLYGSQRFYEFDKKQINKWLGQLIPSRAQFTLVTKLVGEVRLEHEELYGTRYIVQELPKTLLRTLEKISPDKHHQFELPNWSLSIPQGEQIKFNEKIIDLDEPESLIDVPYLVVQYKPSPGLTSPQVGLFLLIATPLDFEPCVACGITDIWSALLTLSIDTDAHSWYDMGVNININFLQNQNRLHLFINGLNHKLEELLDIVFKNILKLSQMATEEQFDIYKTFISDCFENPNMEPTRLSFDLLNRLKHPDHATAFEKSEKIRSLTFDQFQRFANLLTSCVKIELAVTGNASKQDALQIGNYILNKKYFGEILSQEIRPIQLKDSPSKISKTTVKKLFPLGEKCLRTKAINKDSRMSTVHNYYVLSRRCEENELICGLFVALINGLLFHHLRTMQQLGYEVGCNLQKDTQQFGLSIIVSNHADKFCPCDIDTRIDQFLQNLYTYFESTNYFNATFIRGNGIHRSSEYLLNYYTRYLLKHGSEFRKISVQVLACCGGTAENTCLDFTDFCKRSLWTTESSSIPKLTFATDVNKHSESDGNTNNKNKTKRSRSRNDLYFISNIQQFHK